jgi:hypothetical protein
MLASGSGTSARNVDNRGILRHLRGMTMLSTSLLTRDRALDHGRVTSCACRGVRRSSSTR